tara:strand:+ start:983 stop:1138 length:156 start_codon:yes stop_codon:yes gene_type:complete
MENMFSEISLQVEIPEGPYQERYVHAIYMVVVFLFASLIMDGPAGCKLNDL